MKRLEYRGYENLLLEIKDLLPEHLPWDRRAYGLLLLQGDEELTQELYKEMGEEEGLKLLQLLGSCNEEEARMRLYHERSLWALDLAERATIDFGQGQMEKRPLLDSLTTSPLTGFPILFLVLYVGLYYGVGVLGAGKLVDLLEGQFFGELLNPFFSKVFVEHIPWPILQDLFIGPYGILSLGLRYVLGIILPIVGSFFLFFSLLEDTGYLPRVGLLLDRLFKVFGLGGQAVIPMILGFGCSTMGVLTTRILKSERERIIATFLLSLAVPCSAQLGLIFGLLSHHTPYLLLWGGVIFFVFLGSGRALTLLLSGSPSSFLLEVPLLRRPSLKNIVAKTGSRVRWYLLEILPLFLYSSFFIWALRAFGIFESFLLPLQWIMNHLGLPREAASAFFFGFFRRDYGTAGLYDLYQKGALEGPSLVVALVTMTLFVPCMAQMMVNWKERGWRAALIIFLLVLLIAFGVGFLLNQILSFFLLR